MFEVILSPDAEAFFVAADRPLARKLARCFEVLETHARHHSSVKRLTGDLAHLFRYRVGDWRVIYRIDEDLRRVIILTIAHRREVYE